MIRTFARFLARFVAACMLLVLILCAVEVGFRYARLRHSLANQESNSLVATEIIRPHQTTYLEVAPLINIQLASPDRQLVTVQTNELGLRGASVLIPKPAGVYRILCLGGNELFGVGVSQEETIPARLQQMFLDAGHHQVEVLNGGCPEAGPLVEYLRLKQSLLLVQPDLVIYCFSQRDAVCDEDVGGALEVDSQGHPVYASHPQFTGVKNCVVNGLCHEFATIDWFIDASGSAVGLTNQQQQARRATADFRTTVRAIQEIHKLLTDYSIRYIVSVIPEDTHSTLSQNPAQELPAITLAGLLRQGAGDQSAAGAMLVHRPVELSQPEAAPYFRPDDRGLSVAGADAYAHSLGTFLAAELPEILQVSSQFPPKQLELNSEPFRLGFEIVPQ